MSLDNDQQTKIRNKSTRSHRLPRVEFAVTVEYLHSSLKFDQSAQLERAS